MADRVKTDNAKRAEQAQPLAQTVSAQKPNLLAGLKKSATPDDEADDLDDPDESVPVSANGKKNGGSAPPVPGGAEAIINIRLAATDGVLRYTLSAAKAGQFPVLRSGAAQELPAMVQQFIEEFNPSTHSTHPTHQTVLIGG